MSKKRYGQKKKVYPGTDGRSYLLANETPRDSSLLRLPKEEKRELYDVLDELCEEGKVSVDRRADMKRSKEMEKKKMTVITMTEEKNTDQSMAERRKIKIKKIKIKKSSRRESRLREPSSDIPKVSAS